MSVTTLAPPGDRTRPSDGLVATLAVGAAAVIGVAVGLGGVMVLAGLAGLGLMLVVAIRPAVGGVLLIAVTPLVVGIDRGVVLPLLRPNEALLALVSGGLVLRGLHHVATGGRLRVEIRAVDVAIVAMAVTSSITPLLWMVGRGREVLMDDLLYASALWKYLGLYVVIRLSIRTAAQVRVALAAALAAGVVVAVVAVTQSMGLFGVTGMLERWFTPGDVEGLYSGRGTSTLSSSIAVGDVMAFLLAVVIALLARTRRHRLPLFALAVVFVLGAVGSGQFSGFIALGVAAVVAAALTGFVRRLLTVGVPLAAAVAVLLWPVVQARLAGFQSQDGVPQSWTARFDNLSDFFWPTLFADFNWVLGVRPSSRVPAPEVWRDWVFIESGHTWLLWNGGLPFLLAFGVFVLVAVRALLPESRRPDEIGAAATASVAALVTITVLMLFDPHLTMRGTADLNFAFLALGLVAWGRCVGNAAPADSPAAGGPTDQPPILERAAP
jgi:hypothetical protein